MKRKVLSAADLVGLSALAHMLEKNDLEEVAVVRLYQEAGNVLALNVNRLRLDQDTLHITAFARCVAGELMTDTGRAIHFPNGCWEAGGRSSIPPFYLHDDNGNGLFLTDTKTPKKQKAAMLHTLAMILRNDPSRQALAERLLEYEKKQDLWTAADEVDID